MNISALFWYNNVGVIMKYFIWYLIGINIVSLICYKLDKWLAKKQFFRISENWLLFLSIIGGGIGSLFGMFLFRHKTKKIKFNFINVICTILWTIFVLKILK